MPGSLYSFRFHVSEGQQQPSAEPLRGIVGREAASAAATAFSNDEAAARFHLERLLLADTNQVLRGLRTAESTGVIPSLRYMGVQSLPKTETRVVQFVQVQGSIPVFGSKVVVELGRDRNFVSANLDVDDIQQVSRQATFSPQQALQSIGTSSGVPMDTLQSVDSPELNLYKDDDGVWHLVYFFRRVPAKPKEAQLPAAGSDGHGLAPSPRDLNPRFDYLIDAHSGKVLFYYSSDPTLATTSATAITLPIPAKCVGQGEDMLPLVFWGTIEIGSPTPKFKMSDPLRNITTYDLALADLTKSALPAEPISNESGDWGASNRGAVSAHVNLTRVFDFYNSVLMRAGIDDKRMQLTGIVNCTYGSGPEWRNAVWYNDRMWFGQNRDSGGSLQSYSRFLDVIAHELTHGVTQYTCNLVYRDQPGALNESLSDIFGVIIFNWYTVGADSDVRKWVWQIGPGLAANGGPLRDLSNPAVTGDPDHMSKYVTTTADSGGVHTNSNIHNKAAYKLLNAMDASLNLMFKPSEVALFYYLSMTRLSRLADFSAMRDMLITVATTYYMGDPTGLPQKLATIKKAYQDVGI
jgi:bacillolysin